jgi:hypothetical protein
MAKSKEQIFGKAVVYELERVSLLLDSDPELIQVMSNDAVKEELQAIGVGHIPLPEDISQLIPGQTEQMPTNKGRAASAGTSTEESLSQNTTLRDVSGHLTLLLMVAAAATVLTICMAPMLHDLIFTDIVSSSLSWVFSLIVGASTGVFATMLIVSVDPIGRRTTRNSIGVILGTALSLACGGVWLINAATRIEGAFATASTLLSLSLILFLEFSASKLRTRQQQVKNGGRMIDSIRPLRLVKPVRRTAIGVISGTYESISVSMREGWLRMGRVFLYAAGLHRWVQLISVVFLICAISIGFTHWRYHTAGTFNEYVHFGILIDRSLSPDQKACATTFLHERLAQANFTSGGTITLLATGDQSTQNEPMLVSSYKLMKSQRVILGKRDNMRQRTKVLNDLEGQLKGLQASEEEPIYLAISRAVERLRKSDERIDSKFYLYVMTDGEESVESKIKRALQARRGEKITLPTPIDNAGIETIFCGLAETGSALSSSKTHGNLKTSEPRDIDQLRRVWAGLFTHPELVNFASCCGDRHSNVSQFAGDHVLMSDAAISLTNVTDSQLAGSFSAIEDAWQHPSIYLGSSIMHRVMCLQLETTISKMSERESNLDSFPDGNSSSLIKSCMKLPEDTR